MDGDELNEVEALFERAVASEDEAFLRAEEHLVRAGAEAVPTLQQHLNHPDPIGRLTARVALEWAESGDDFDKARRYLSAVAKRFAPTAAAAPPIRGVVENLTARFGARLTQFLALHLAKESQPDDWHVLATLAYLDRHKNPAVTDALIRFATRTSQPLHQELAARVLREIGDPALGQKLAAASQRATLPPVLAALATPARPTA